MGPSAVTMFTPSSGEIKQTTPSLKKHRRRHGCTSYENGDGDTVVVVAGGYVGVSLGSPDHVSASVETMKISGTVVGQWEEPVSYTHLTLPTKA